MKKLTGLIAAPFTPFDAKGDLAIEQVVKMAALYHHNQVQGAFIAGSTGEGASLSLSEKEALMSAWGQTKTAYPDLRRIFMLGGTCLPDMQYLAGRATALGMDGVSILCPYYFKPASVEGLVELCRQVAAAAPELPFYYYHIPVLTSGLYSMVRFLELAEKQIPNLAGIKYSHSNIMEFQACLAYGDGKYELLWGTDEALLSGLAAGARGAVGSTYNYAAPLYHRIIKAFADRDYETAQKFQLLSVRIVELLVKYGGAGAGKAFMKLIGLDCGRFRSPLESPDAVAMEALRQELEQIGFFDHCSKLDTNSQTQD